MGAQSYCKWIADSKFYFLIDVWILLEKKAKKEVNIPLHKSERATNLFRRGYLCAPSAFLTFSQELELDADIAFKIATGFDAGITGRSKTCGAITEGVMAIGLKRGRGVREHKEVEEETFKIFNEFINRFKVKHKTIECKELIGYNLVNPKELAMARESGVFETICPSLVQSLVEILEIQLNYEKNSESFTRHDKGGKN